MRDPHTRGVLLVLGAAVLWGTSGTAQSFAAPALSSYWVGAFRLAVAALFFGAWHALDVATSCRRRAEEDGPSARRARPRTPARRPRGARAVGVRRGVVLAAASMTLYNIAFFAGVRASTVALGTALALGSAPLWGGLLQLAVERRRPGPVWWAGVGIAVAGLAIALVTTGQGAVTMSGVALCLLAGLAYALYARATSTLVSDASPVAVTGTVFALAAALALPLAFALAGPPVLTPIDVLVLGWLGVAATGVAYFLFALGLRVITSATAVALGMAEPVAAVGFAIAVVGERPGGVALAGLGTVLVGLAVLVRGEGRAP